LYEVRGQTLMFRLNLLQISKCAGQSSPKLTFSSQNPTHILAFTWV